MPLRYGGMAWLRYPELTKYPAKSDCPMGGLVLRYDLVVRLRYGGCAVDLTGLECAMRNALPRYEIAQDGSSITFQPCNTTSYNPNDIKHVYCGRCHRFISDLWLHSTGKRPSPSTK